MMTLGQLDAPQALQDLEGLKLMLHKVPNETLKLQLAQGAERCEQMIRDAMAQDLDAAPGIECVTQLYEAYETARRLPVTSNAQASSQQPQPEPFISANTIYWVSGIGALVILFASSLSGE